MSSCFVSALIQIHVGAIQLSCAECCQCANQPDFGCSKTCTHDPSHLRSGHDLPKDHRGSLESSWIPHWHGACVGLFLCHRGWYAGKAWSFIPSPCTYIEFSELKECKAEQYLQPVSVRE
ncbi:unnamed protein product [Tuber aestivum]|uniref:Secreted protein n=1 Tax=Tuber aestivum TaxID=59557 RepID=A0A292PNN3_9PEZI|nr:unnamed protein product [Tuber aestivum]